MIQLQALNKILQEHDAEFLTRNNLGEEFFSDFSSEFKYIKEHIDRYGQTPDLESFLVKFPTFDVVKVTETFPFLLNGLIEDKNKRFLIRTFNQVREALQAGDVERAMSVYQNAASSQQQTAGVQSIDILEDTTRYDRYIEKTRDFQKYYVRTGFPELDSITGGWERQEELATISARPGVGKSFVLLKCALAAASQGLNVGLYSGEMSEDKVGYRIDTLMSHLSNRDIIHGNARIQNDYKKYMDNISETISGSIKVLTPAMISGPAGVGALRAFVEKDNLDILFVDQHSLLEDDRKARNPVEKAANISRDLKNLQVLKKIPIIAVSQQNRSSTEGGIGTEHIAQADRIGQDSTIVIFLEQNDGILTMSLAKARDSVSGQKIHYAIDLDHGIFTYLPDGTKPQDEEAVNRLQKEFEDPAYGGEDVF